MEGGRTDEVFRNDTEDRNVGKAFRSDTADRSVSEAFRNDAAGRNVGAASRVAAGDEAGTAFRSGFDAGDTGGGTGSRGTGFDRADLCAEYENKEIP